MLGYFRSGTSLVANILHELGGYVENDYRPVSAMNAKGYWESKELAQINHNLLDLVSRRAGPGYSPPDFPTGFNEASFSDLRERARKYIDRMSEFPFWASKQPDTTLTLPFWKPLLPRQTSYIICIRNPLAVSRSAIRWKDDPTLTSRLWVGYNLSAVVNTLGERVLMVFYEDFANDPSAEVRNIAEFTGAHFTGSSLGIYERQLDHFGGSDEILRDEFTGWDAKLLYHLLVQSKTNGASLEKLARGIVEPAHGRRISFYRESSTERETSELKHELLRLRSQNMAILSHPYVRLGFGVKNLARRILGRHE